MSTNSMILKTFIENPMNKYVPVILLLAFPLYTTCAFAEAAKVKPSPATLKSDTPALPQIKADGMSLSEVMEIVRADNPLLKAGHESIAATCYGQNPIQDDFPKIHNF